MLNLNLAFASSTYCILLFENITLSKSFIHQQHKMYEKGLKKMPFISSKKYLNIRRAGHFVVILVSFITRLNPVFFLMSFPEQHVRKHVCINSTKLHSFLVMTIA
jgi:hypothetical protein